MSVVPSYEIKHVELERPEIADDYAFQTIGNVALSDTATENGLDDFPTLPEGYYYEPSLDVTDKGEIADVKNSTGAFDPVNRPDLEAEGKWNKIFGIHTTGIGVRTRWV